MKQWIKFYTEALHDRKLRRLSRVDKSVYYDLLLLAGQEDHNGLLPTIEDIAFELDMSTEDMTESLNTLMKIGVISKDCEGELYVTMFNERQNSNLSNAERAKKFRDSKKMDVTEVTSDKKTEEKEPRYSRNAEPRYDCTNDDVRNVTVEENRIEKNRKDIEENREEKNREEYIGAVAPQKPQKKSNRGTLKPFGIAENVMLSDSEYQKLQDKLGKDLADKQIDELSLYMGKSEKNAKKYTNHYFAVLSWSRMSSENPIPQQSTFIQPKKKTYDFSDVFNMMQDGSDSGEVIDI